MSNILNKPKPHHFLFYGNSSRERGTGHMMRLLALAQCVFDAGHQVTFLYKHCLEHILQRLKQEQFGLISIAELPSSELLAQLKATHLVIDDYDLTEEENALIKTYPLYTTAFDDGVSPTWMFTDCVINANATKEDTAHYMSLRAQRWGTAQQANMIYCLGNQYIVLRREFRLAAKQLPVYQSRNALLITLGGTDVKSLSIPICLAAIEHCPELLIHVVLGAPTQSESTQVEAIQTQHPQVRLHTQVTHIAPLMSQSCIAISAAGSTLFELGCMGVPTIALVCADNQESSLTPPANYSWYHALDFRLYGNNKPNNCQMLNHFGAHISSLYADASKRIMMHKNGLQHVDGLGALRVLSKIT